MNDIQLQIKIILRIIKSLILFERFDNCILTNRCSSCSHDDDISIAHLYIGLEIRENIFSNRRSPCIKKYEKMM